MHQSQVKKKNVNKIEIEIFEGIYFWIKVYPPILFNY